MTPGKQKPAETLNHRNTGAAPEPFEKQRREQIGIKPAAVKEPERPYNIKPIIKPENNPYARILNRVPDQPQNIPNNPVSQQAQTQQATQQSQSQPVNESTPATSALSADQENITDKDNSVNVSRITSEITVTNTQAGEGTATQTKTTAPAEVAAPQPQVPEKEKKYSQLDMFGTKMLSEEARPKHRLIGQVFKTFWLIEYDKKLFIMDQHAAHEKVKFEELMNNYRNKKAIPQYLMPPAIVTLTADEITFLNDNMEFFENLGYTIESFGGREYKLSSVPANLFGIDGRELFLEFIGELSENNKNSTITAFIAKLSTMACKAAIKGNTEISFKEADVLIDQLLKLENPYTCPHGRPTLISMTEAELEKKFKRIV